MLAAPPAPQREAAQAWAGAYKSLDREIEKWAVRLAAGQPPLSVGEANRLQTLITAIRALKGMPVDNAQVIAAAQARAVEAARASLFAAADALPGHAVKAAQAASEAVGWTYQANTPAFNAVVQGQIGKLTGDFTDLAVSIQSKMIEDLGTAVLAGDGPRELAARLREVIDPSFRMGQSRSVMVARTSLARAYDVATQGVYRDAHQAGVLHGWRWLARPGACDICRSLHGSVWDVEMDTFRHPNCTCTMVPVLPDEGAARVEFGDRWEPYRDTSMDDLELRTSKSGWTSWTIKKKPPGA